MTDNFCYDDFVQKIEVSRETYHRLENYIALLKKWQGKINLISDSTVSDIWKRHIMDSGQLMKYLSESDKIIDIGSGAGFPGMVLAVLGIKNMTLVESDTRKAAFLREAARVAGVEINIINQRIESIAHQDINVITARGFASIDKMFSMIAHIVNISIKLLLLKGKSYLEEVEEAKRNWSFDYQTYPSITGDGAVIILNNVSKREG